MTQGNPNKVNAIVDEIVENNNVFKLKSPIEQDKEKDSIAQSINSALSVLNEIGKELVLQELSVDPDEKFKGFIDSVGNVDISGLSQMTATIVKEKIIEAEKEGIDLRQGQPVFKDSTKALLVGGILTVVVINEMVNNFDNLTTEQRGLLRENYEHLTAEQRSKYDKGMLDKIKNSNLDNKTQKELTDFFEGDFHSAINNILNILQKNHGSDNFDLSQISPSEILKIIENLDVSKELKDKLKEYNFEKLLSIDKGQQKLVDLYIQRDLADRNGNLKEVEKLDSLIVQYKNSPEYKEYLNISEASKDKQKEVAKNQNSTQKTENLSNDAQNNNQVVPNEERNHQISTIVKISLKIQQEIEQLPNKLTKEGFSQEEISEAMKMYSAMIQSIPLEEYKGMNSSEKIIEFFKSGMEPPENKSDEILFIIAQNDFGGYLQEILTSPELLQEKFLPILENEIQKLDEKQITDSELEQAKNTEKIKEEFLDASGAIESQKQQESTKLDSPNIPTTPEEHIQESVTSYEQEALEEASQNMAIVKQDNSFLGKIKRVFANMKDMKNKDNSKGFFARLGASIQTVFGNKKDEFDEKQDENITSSTTQRKEQTRECSKQTNYLTQHFDVNEKQAVQDLKKKQDAKDKDSQLSQDDQEFGNL